MVSRPVSPVVMGESSQDSFALHRPVATAGSQFVALSLLFFVVTQRPNGRASFFGGFLGLA